jgi:DNA-directed RNA polymerase subunit RPC12/RpoP
MPPENESGDGIECPECGSLHGYVTDKGHKGSAYWIQMKCGQCGAEWGHDNFDALDDR